MLAGRMIKSKEQSYYLVVSINNYSENFTKF